MNSDIWIPRNAADRIQKASKSRPAILLTGVRQSRTSSLLQREFPDAKYISFDHLNQIQSATKSPDLFLNRLKEQVILDEIQYVPGLLRELKPRINAERQNYGSWLPTGNQKFELKEKTSESLTGRTSIFHLETLSAKELRNSPHNQLPDFIWKGEYPDLWSNPHLDITDFFESDIRTHIERDLSCFKNLTDQTIIKKAGFDCFNPLHTNIDL